MIAVALFIVTSMLVVALCIAVETVIERIDCRCVKADLARRGCRPVEIDFILHEGWRARVYRVVYVDSAGYPHCATCETSCMSGPSWGRDRVIGSPILA